MNYGFFLKYLPTKEYFLIFPRKELSYEELRIVWEIKQRICHGEFLITFFFWDFPFFQCLYLYFKDFLDFFYYFSRTIWPTSEHFLIFSGTSWRRIVNFLRVSSEDLSSRIFENIFFLRFPFFRCFFYMPRTFYNSLQRFSVYLKFVNFTFSNFLTEN